MQARTADSLKEEGKSRDLGDVIRKEGTSAIQLIAMMLQLVITAAKCLLVCPAPLDCTACRKKRCQYDGTRRP